MPSAADILHAKTPIPVRMTSEQWARISPEITVQSIFGARVDDLSTLLKIRQQAASILSGGTSKTEARHANTDMLDAIGYTPEPGDEGTIRDLSGTARQNLILETQTTQAASRAQAEACRASIAYPAYRLVRMGERTQPRDWPSRWCIAYGAVRNAPPEPLSLAASLPDLPSDLRAQASALMNGLAMWDGDTLTFTGNN